MNWGRLKTVMIVILLVACIILGISIRSISAGRRYIDTDTLSNLRAILEADNIIVTEDAVPRERFDPAVFYGTMPSDYYTEVFDILSEDEIYRSYPIPYGIMIMTSHNERFWINSYFGFSYLAPEIEQADFPATTAFGTMNITEEEKRELLACAEAFLKLDSFVVPEVRDRYELVAAGLIRVSERQEQYLLVKLYIDGVPVCTNELVLLIRNGQVVAADGSWTFLTGDKTDSAPIYDQVNILISEKKNIDIDRKNGILSGIVAIRSIEKCYCPYADEESGTVYFVPGWCVTLENGSRRVYDAVNNFVFSVDALG